MATVNVDGVGSVTLSGTKPYTLERVGPVGGFQIKDNAGRVVTSTVAGTPNVVWAKAAVPQAIITAHNA